MAVLYDTPLQFECIVLFIFRFGTVIGEGLGVA